MAIPRRYTRTSAGFIAVMPTGLHTSCRRRPRAGAVFARGGRATVEGHSDEAGVFLGAPIPAVVPAPLGSAGRGSLPGRLALVMPPAERGQVGVSVVVTSANVVNVG